MEHGIQEMDVNQDNQNKLEETINRSTTRQEKKLLVNKIVKP